MGNNKTWLDLANHVILEVNSWQPIELKGVHDIYYGTALPPNRVTIPIIRPLDRRVARGGSSVSTSSSDSNIRPAFSTLSGWSMGERVHKNDSAQVENIGHA